MIALLHLEAIGDDVRYRYLARRRRAAATVREHARHWHVLEGPWVSRIYIGPSGAVCGERIPPRRDFTGADHAGRRGIWHVFALIDGTYQVHEVHSLTSGRYYFVRVDGGQAHEI